MVAFTPLGTQTQLSTPKVAFGAPSIASTNPFGISNSTPQMSSGGPSLLSSLGVGQSTLGGGSIFSSNTPQAASPLAVPSNLTPNQNGGINFAPVKAQAVNPIAAIGSNASKTFSTPNGGTYDATSGSFAPAQGFSIDTSNIPSSALSSTANYGDLTQKHSQYQDAVNALVQAQQYSPDYLNAYKAQQNAQLNQAALNSNYYTGNNLPGDTLNYAQGATAKAQAQNSLVGAQVGIDLQAQALIRQGNIAGAQALVQGTSPQSVSPGSSLVTPTDGQEVYSGLGGYQAVQGIQNVNSLMAQFPDAGITQQDSPEQATQKAQSSPSFQARNLQQISLPGGGVSFVNKNQLVTNPQTGQTSIISPAQAAQAEGYSKNIGELSSQAASIGASIAAADNNFPLLLQQLKGAGINNFNSPLANLIEGNAVAKLNGSRASYNALVQSLQTTYSAILSRGGTVTNETRDEAGKLVNGTLSYADMQKLYTTLKKEADGVLKGIDSVKQQNVNSLNQLYGQGQSMGASGGSIYDF